MSDSHSTRRLIDAYPFVSGSNPIAANHEHVLILHLKRGLDADIKRVLTQHSNLSLPQWRVISVLYRSSDVVSQKELVSRTYITQGQASRALFTLQTNGLVVASQSEKDRRSWDYLISDKGRKQFEVLLPHMEARRKDLDSALSLQEREQFLLMARKIATVLEERLENN
ncbi:MarR family winged helix-turn-helix transcriptional regulator [Sulfitobacter sp. F26204]|uniref:MarR family winged helix-turn-helix transcriptional regulator n=1 Tax=Sulfitobacter sp. F26204 TaxID=2996014 RepID=UPI00225E36B9|nr:MarR family winged helix-turn-helix transcriptional regulator [Sulfitobacter sp. F26204]MCX7560234.1 MarR family winged helix-turn-helix transcriptional regulator [Sulfitobacter sp. F26204]